MSRRLTMPRKLFLLAVICLSSISTMRADQLMASVQQTLKEQGFYYGKVDGKKNSETTAAIRRYQIRNGLKINGELNIETQRSLGVKAEQSSISEKKETPSSPENFASPELDRKIPSPRPSPSRTYASIPRPEASEARDDFPDEVSPTNRPQRVIANAQTMLARRGYYRSKIDGVYGPETALALRAYQARVGLEVTGRLDLETRAALGMLPGRRRLGPPSRRFPWWRREPIYRGELVPE